MTLRFIRRNLGNEDIFHIINTDITELKRYIIQASKKVFRATQIKAMQTDDIAELKKALDK